MSSERITQYLEYKGISKNKFYKETGLSNGFLDKVKDIGTSKLETILYKYPDINPMWIISGKGKMLIDEKSESDIKSNSKPIPLINTTAFGGHGHSLEISSRNIKSYYNIPKFGDNQVDFLIEVQGNSMTPNCNNGDIVACKLITESAFIQWNNVHLIATKNQSIMIKRIKKGSSKDSLTLASDNDMMYPSFEIPKDEIIGIALVIGVIRTI